MAIVMERRLPPSELIPSRAAFHLVRSFEGLSLTAYADPASPLARTGRGSGEPYTVGYGHTGPDVTPGLHITLAKADELLNEDMAKAAQIVRDAIKEPLTASEFSGLTTMALNLGKIPPSIRACLNGGTTDKGVKMEPGSYGSALAQFPRNCRAGGIPMRGLLRRRLAEACLYSNLPWENACSINLVRLALTPTGDIDWAESTTLEDTLAFARQDIPEAIPPLPPISKPKFEPQWPRTELPPIVVAKPIPAPEPSPAPTPEPTITIITDIEKPAADLSPPAGAKVEPEPPTAPGMGPAPLTPSETTAGQVLRETPAAEREPAPSSVKVPAPPLPPVVAPPKPPPVILPKSVNLDAIPYGDIKTDKGGKLLTDSKRFIGLLIVGGGSILQILAARNIVTSTVGAVFFDMSRDPVIVSIIAGGIVWIAGVLTVRHGTKVTAKGMENATQVLV